MAPNPAERVMIEPQHIEELARAVDDKVGSLFPYDILYDAYDSRFCEALPDNSWQLRLITEAAFSDVTLVYCYDGGAVLKSPMKCYAVFPGGNPLVVTPRFKYWEITLTLRPQRIAYSFALLDLHPSDHVCDVGCGTGDDVLALAQFVAPGGHAVGIDVSLTMIREAERRSAAAGIAAEFVPMDAQRLTLPDAQFDGVRAERLLQHLPDPEAALAEMVRVTKPGGRIVIWEANLDMLVIDAPDYATSWVMQRFICDSFRHGRIGHELYRRFKDLGLSDVQATPLVREWTDLAQVESAFDLRTSVERAAAAGLTARAQAMAWLAFLEAARDTVSATVVKVPQTPK